MHGPREHVTHLHLHHKCHGNQEDGKYILHHDENLAQDHLVPAPERTLDDVNGLVTRGREGRKQTADGTQDQYAGQICQDISGRKHEGKPHTGVADAQHHLVRIAGGNQAVHHRGQQVGQQERCSKAGGGKGYGFADVFPEDTALIRPQKPPGGHFLGALSRERQAEVYIIEDGG